MFGMIRDLIRKIFVRGEFEQFGWSRIGVCHGTNLARVRFETINHSVKGWRSAAKVSGLGFQLASASTVV